MDDPWKVIGEFAATLHIDRIAAIADAIVGLDSVADFERAKKAFGPNADQEKLERLRVSWAAAPETSPSEIAAAFRGAAAVAKAMDGRGALELVWTGPKTGLIPTRQTERVILEVIESAKSDLFLVTYVFYKAASIAEALNAAAKRGAKIRILLECSTAQGGTVRGDSISAMRKAVPAAMIYVWDPSIRKPEGDISSAAVHAKCAVADGDLAFITSANLTSAAMERNMELGMLIRGGPVPEKLRQHLAALITTKVITELE